MTNYCIIIFIVLFVSCKNGEAKTSAIKDSKLESKLEVVIDTINDGITIERYFPKQHQSIVFDTIMSEKGIDILIEQKTIESYVVNEFIAGKDNYRDKYRDFQIRLRIKLIDSIVLDTVLNKKSFIDKTSETFINQAIFLNYWFDGIANDSLKFRGVINKPETDWALDFKHRVSLNSGKLELSEWVYN